VSAIRYPNLRENAVKPHLPISVAEPILLHYPRRDSVGIRIMPKQSGKIGDCVGKLDDE
jgi:hypothetical protein